MMRQGARMVGRFVGEIVSVLPRLVTALDGDQDGRQRQVILDVVAQRIGAAINQPLSACRRAVEELCVGGEPDVASVGATADAVREAVRHALVKATVRYVIVSGGWQREVELYLRRGAVLRTVDGESLAWDDCPSEVREAHLREGAKDIVFNLTPRR